MRGMTTRRFGEIVETWAAEKRKLKFVINEEYRRRVEFLAEHGVYRGRPGRVSWHSSLDTRRHL